MDWYPLLNSLRIAAISAVVVFFAGIAAAYYIAKLPRLVKGVLDVILTLPLVLPPTVVGYLILRILGPKRLIGAWVLETFGIRLVMTWWSAIFATVIVVFPLMYRTVRGAFESFDETLAYAGRTLGLSNTYVFWRIRMPCCRQGVLAGAVRHRPARFSARLVSYSPAVLFRRKIKRRLPLKCSGSLWIPRRWHVKSSRRRNTGRMPKITAPDLLPESW